MHFINKVDTASPVSTFSGVDHFPWFEKASELMRMRARQRVIWLNNLCARWQTFDLYTTGPKWMRRRHQRWANASLVVYCEKHFVSRLALPYRHQQLGMNLCVCVAAHQPLVPHLVWTTKIWRALHKSYIFAKNRHILNLWSHSEFQVRNTFLRNLILK